MGIVDAALRYARTVPTLRPRQILYRPLRRLQRVLPLGPPRVEARFAAARAGRLRAELLAAGQPGSRTLTRADDLCRGRVRILDRTAELRGGHDWEGRPQSPLWRYQLHAFGWAEELVEAFRQRGDPRYARRWIEFAESWLDATRGTRGEGWDPYPLSLRIGHWIRAVLLLDEALPARTGQRLLEAIAQQAAYLDRRLEYHLLGNHLLENLRALALAGLLFDGAAPEHWRIRRAGQYWDELARQVLPDGVHQERSPMYHDLLLQGALELLLLQRAAGLEPGETPVRLLGAMLEATACLHRPLPDGRPYLFNDTSEATDPDLPGLGRLALRLGLILPPPPRGSWHLTASGFLGYAGEQLRIAVDAGEPGPRWLPAHAHCGMLSYELDLGGGPLVVDSGVAGYDGDPLREYGRSTRAHNTVQIGGREQHEVWGVFRMARRAKLHRVEVNREPALRMTAEISPYWSTRVRHERVIQVGEAGVDVTDQVRGADGAPVASMVHLHPGLAVEPAQDAWIATGQTVRARIIPSGFTRVRLVRGETRPAQGWYCPSFGVAQPAPCLVMETVGSTQRFGYRIELV
ncbi:MAG: heparinase II/III domain-containing protein [Gemmatimonadales bacterium]